MCSWKLIGIPLLLLVALTRAFAAEPSPVTGSWGGEHVALVANAGGARVELDCAFGHLGEPLRPGPDGAFEARGTYVREAGGPVELGRPATAEPETVVYRGHLDGAHMRLTILVPETGREIGTFSLCSGCQPRLEKCL